MRVRNVTERRDQLMDAFQILGQEQWVGGPHAVHWSMGAVVLAGQQP
jgi:hypothetical protein